jgi:hypothetical protein
MLRSAKAFEGYQVHAIDGSIGTVRDFYFPTWHADTPVNRACEMRLYDYYGRPTYWSDGDRRQAG